MSPFAPCASFPLERASLIFFLVLCLCGSVRADQLYLRDGTNVLDGTILHERQGTYLMQTSSGVRRIPKNAVKYAFYSDPQKAAACLNLDAARMLVSAKQPSNVRILSAVPFGGEILQAVKQASETIWISVYYLSGSQAASIKEFYETLRSKATEGVEVVVLCEFGPGTSLMVKRATMEYAEALSASGIQVLYMQDYRVLHKKMIIIDKSQVYLGSSNLTLAGVVHNTELNVVFSENIAVQKAVADYESMRKRAKTRAELN